MGRNELGGRLGRGSLGGLESRSADLDAVDAFVGVDMPLVGSAVSAGSIARAEFSGLFDSVFSGGSSSGFLTVSVFPDKSAIRTDTNLRVFPLRVDIERVFKGDGFARASFDSAPQVIGSEFFSRLFTSGSDRSSIVAQSSFQSQGVRIGVGEVNPLYTPIRRVVEEDRLGELVLGETTLGGDISSPLLISGRAFTRVDREFNLVTSSGVVLDEESILDASFDATVLERGVVVEGTGVRIGVQDLAALLVSSNIETDLFTKRVFNPGVLGISSEFSVQKFARSLVTDVVVGVGSSFFERNFTGSVGLGGVVGSSATFLDSRRILLEWALGQKQLGKTLEEEREWDEMNLTIRYEKDLKEDDIRSLISRSDKAEPKMLSSGGFRTVDLSGVGEPFTLRAPTDRNDVRSVDEWYVTAYDKELANRSGDVYDIELSLAPERHKSFDNEYGTFDEPRVDPSSDTEWTFEFEFGEISSRRVSVDTSESEDGSSDVIEMTLVLEPEEVRVIEENASHLNLSKNRSVPDGDDVVDDMSDGRNTVFMSPPGNADEPIPEGEYVFVGWTTEWIGGAYQSTWEVMRE